MKNLSLIIVSIAFVALITWGTNYTVDYLLADEPVPSLFKVVGLSLTFSLVYSIVLLIFGIIISSIYFNVRMYFTIKKRMRVLRQQQEAHDLHMFHLGLVKAINKQGEWLRSATIDALANTDAAKPATTSTTMPQPEFIEDEVHVSEPEPESKPEPVLAPIDAVEYQHCFIPKPDAVIIPVNGNSTKQAIADYVFTCYGYYAAQLSDKDKRTLVSKGREQEKLHILNKIMPESMTDPRITASQYNRLDVLFKTLSIREK